MEYWISALFILLPEGIKWLWASWSRYQLVLSWLICLGLLDPPKTCINSCPAPSTMSVPSDWPGMQHMHSYLFKMAANPWLFGHWQHKMAANLLIPGHLAPHAPWSSPEPISCAQNGFHFLWIAYLTIDCSKWLPIQDFLVIGSSKWLPFYLYLAIWLHMLLDPVQSWSVVLKMAANPWFLGHW